MSLEHPGAKALEKWLQKESGYDFVCNYVKRKLNRSSEELHVLSRHMHQSSSQELCNFSDETCHDFLEFILGSVTRQKGGADIVINHFLAGKYCYFLDLLWAKYLWTLKDVDRLKGSNPRAYLYRRLREAVSSDPQFTTVKGAHTPLYFCLGANETEQDKVLLNGLVGETYRDWPIPPKPLNADKKGGMRLSSVWLVEIALFFYRVAAERHPDFRSFPVSELVRYLATISPWINIPVRVENEQDSSVSMPAMVVDFDETRLDHMEQKRTLEPLASQLVACWERRKCCVFAWRVQEKPITLALIAERLGLKNHNQAHTMFTSAKQSLRNFCQNWPGPPIGELEPELATDFVGKVREYAKKKCDGP